MLSIIKNTTYILSYL